MDECSIGQFRERRKTAFPSLFQDKMVRPSMSLASTEADTIQSHCSQSHESCMSLQHRMKANRVMERDLRLFVTLESDKPMPRY